MYTSTLLTEQNQDAQRGCVCKFKIMKLYRSILLLFEHHLYIFLSVFSQKGSPGKFSMNVRHNDDDRPDSAGPAATTIERGVGYDAAHD